VRRVIEDELLTESGYRESLAEERVVKALAAAGAEPDALSRLVDRRLLRIEERLDLRRVELTHDVLCSVVGASRNLRHEREARDEAERQLAAQQERAAETRRTLRKTRRFAMIAAGLMLVAVVSAVFSWISWNRAKAADAQAQKARADAERLVGFLIEDFYNELQPTGRLETMGKLAHMAVQYYDGLPPKLVTPQTQIYRGMALIREAEAMLARGDYQQANPHLDEAYALFAKLRDAGNKSEAVLIGLALAKFTRFSAWGVSGSPGSKPEDLPQAADLLRPLVAKPDASREVRMLYADVLNYLSHTLQGEARIAPCEESRRILVGLGAKDLTDLRAASIYADVSDSEARHSVDLGRIADAERLEKEVYDIAEQVLAQRPGDLRSMANRALAADLLGRLGVRRNDFVAAAEYAAKSEQAGENYVRFNPSDFNSWVYWVRGKDLVSEVLLEQGRVAEAVASMRATVALEDDPRKPGSLGPILWQTWFSLASAEAQEGHSDAAEVTLKKAAQAANEAAAFEPEGTSRRKMYPLMVESRRARNLYMFGDSPAGRDIAIAALARLRAIDLSKERFASITRDNIQRMLLTTQALTAIRLGEYAEAEAATRERLSLRPNPFYNLGPQVEMSRTQVLLAYTIAKQGRRADARGIVEPEVERYRAEQKNGAGGTTFQIDLANALFVSAVSQADDATGRAQRAADLAAAEQALARLTAEARQMFDARDAARRIAEARAGD
ncbi:MAG TPA: hypothetical protein VF277_05950, partial [Steroidobacteraceae bacterium]